MQSRSVALLTTGAATAAVAAGLLLWRRLRFEQFLQAEEEAVRLVACSEQELQEEPSQPSLPEPVERFLQRSVKLVGACPRLWVARGSGTMRFDSGGSWMPLDSSTVGAANTPAFCYIGTLGLGLGSLLWCRGREVLLRGTGAMEWRLWAALPLASSQGGHLNQSALLRWLAEAVCFPPALLPSRHLAWLPGTGDPQRSAVARLTLSGTTATATLTFDDEGRFVELRSGDYWRVMPDGTVSRRPWIARGSAHQRFELSDGSRIELPTVLSAAWEEPNGSEFEHIRFVISSVSAEW